MTAPEMVAHLYLTPEPSAPLTSEAEEEEPDEGSSSLLIGAAVNAPPRAQKWELDQKCQKKQGGEEGRRDSGGGG